MGAVIHVPNVLVIKKKKRMANPYGIEGKIELLRYEGEAVKCISFQTGIWGIH